MKLFFSAGLPLLPPAGRDSGLFSPEKPVPFPSTHRHPGDGGLYKIGRMGDILRQDSGVGTEFRKPAGKTMPGAFPAPVSA